MFTLAELAAYLPETAENPARAGLIRDLTLGLVYSVIPQTTADPSVVAKAIGLEVAARAYRNADGYSSETVDDYTYRRDAATRAAGVYLTADERSRLLALSTDTSRPRARSVRLRSWSVPQL
jgi:hypothetical protein